jgi:hypothetical protein
MGKIIYIPASAAPGSPMGGWTFEWIAKNIEGYNIVYAYTGNNLTTKVFDKGGGSFLTATYSYTGNNLTTLTFSGDVPFGIPTTKNYTYTGNNLTGVTYS